MPRFVNLKDRPYNLNEEQIKWVEETLEKLSLEEKIGQLFFNLFFLRENNFTENKLSNEEILKKFHIGGARYEGGTKEEVQNLLNNLQKHSKIPLLIAANCDSGGNGACLDGTYIASAAMCEASGDCKLAYDAGYVSGVEETALGVNVNFDPCVDIVKNFRNTIINTRSYGKTAGNVIKYTNSYIEGLRKSEVITCIKHFPGDGVEERDQHLILGINDMSIEEWENSFGKVYRNHIDKNSVEMIMAGHIALPKYQKYLNAKLKDKDILPATLSEELIQILLKEKLNFNGLVVTDASHMLGMTASMRRKDYVPKSIAAGCDMFLFFNDIEEDFNYMLQGYKEGIITEDRLNDAVRRILGLKAKLNLHIKKANNSLLKKEKDLEIIGCKEHKEMQKEAQDKGISLIKNTLNELPLDPKKHKRIRLYIVEGEKNGIYKPNEKFKEMVIKKLEKEGFEVTLNDTGVRIKGSIEKYRKEVDAALLFLNIKGYAEANNMRIKWSGPMSNEIPWYVYEVPTFAVSFNFTNHLHDISMVKCMINAYSDTEETINQVIDKMMGKSEFKGQNFNDNVFAELFEAKL